MNWVFYSSENTPTRVAVVRMADNATVGAIASGPNLPTVNIIDPSGGSFTDAMTIRWSGSDPDGDTVLYTVRYSPDNGATWISLATALADTQLAVPFNDGLPGGAQARVQVLASDGMHTTVSTSAPFSVAQHAPQAAIFDGDSRLLDSVMITSAQQSEVVVLYGDAYDAEDGPLSGTALQWTITGPITQTGNGDTIVNCCRHLTCFTATDSNVLQRNHGVTIAPIRPEGSAPTRWQLRDPLQQRTIDHAALHGCDQCCAGLLRACQWSHVGML
jgi:hypothetical protein